MKNSRKKKNLPPKSRYPRKKKAFGQHFLRKKSVVWNMIERLNIGPETSVLEIGCGDGFLTQAILDQTNCKKLLCFEIDPEWAKVVREKIDDARLEIREQNILEFDLRELESEKPWVILSNLPYNITFPCLFRIQKNKDLFEEGVVMIQEEVAQKIDAKKSFTAMFLQHHLQFELMEKIEPGAFVPPPKVFSRLIYFKPKYEKPIDKEEGFWKFIKIAFKAPRRTLRNNLKTAHYELDNVSDELLAKRAQQLTFEDLLGLWKQIVT